MGNNDLRLAEEKVQDLIAENYVLTAKVLILENKLLKMKEVAEGLVGGLEQVLLNIEGEK